MKCVDRNGYEIKQNETQNQMLGFLYQTQDWKNHTCAACKTVGFKAMGILLNLSVSKWLIGSFVKKNDIDLSEYEDRKYRSYNDFFTRKIKEGHRKIDEQPEHLIAPCDSKLKCIFDFCRCYVLK